MHGSNYELLLYLAVSQNLHGYNIRMFKNTVKLGTVYRYGLSIIDEINEHKKNIKNALDQLNCGHFNNPTSLEYQSNHNFMLNHF